MRKHAYLIIAHNQFELLEKLIESLTYEYNDFYILIDKKNLLNFSETLKKKFEERNVNLILDNSVFWGTYSQIEAELTLFKKAFYSDVNYSYYHVLSGIDFPLKQAKRIHQDIEKNYPTEYIAFAERSNLSNSSLERIKFYSAPQFVIKMFGRRPYSFLTKKLLFPIQRLLKINRLKEINFSLGKGSNWVSVTDKLVKELLSQKFSKFIDLLLTNSFCGDELLVQTVALNSENIINEVSNINLRYIDWKRGNPYVFVNTDLEELIRISNQYYFCRKVNWSNSQEIIRYFN
ncbi:beta-1,6-N-acetylglucosaminyltransferase [Enterococcus hailinensis]|uniref:beta-1,6-N-acetylglucosaminyltransferase n=1 Tax=Enterococcus hailinensis TaxID=3238988 RepID=UPI0038B2DDDD